MATPALSGNPRLHQVLDEVVALVQLLWIELVALAQGGGSHDQEDGKRQENLEETGDNDVRRGRKCVRVRGRGRGFHRFSNVQIYIFGIFVEISL